MPFKMIANRTVYRADEATEYQKGQTFTVDSERERDRLIKSKRARLDDSKPAAMRRPQSTVQKVMTPDPVPSVTAAEPAPSETTTRPLSRYRRSDLRSED